MRKHTNKLLALLLVICLFAGMMPAVMAAVPQTLYLKPASNWLVDGARFAAYFWNEGGATGWASCNDSNGDGYYEVGVPSGMTYVIFCRMNGGTSDNNWDNKWNQTEDLMIMTDGQNCVNINEGAWDGNDGNKIAFWSTYGDSPIVTDPTTPSDATTPSDSTDPTSPIDPSIPSGEVESIQDGMTLHCWNWSFADIENNMAKIAEQGYTAVQTSPIQQAKEATVGNGMKSHWWVYYQPMGFHIDQTTGSALGTKAQFESMCATAHKYGVRVIVDVVANHLGNRTGNNLADTIIDDLKNDSSCWHDISINTTNYNDRYDITQHCMAGLPDLNTANKKVQNYALNFLKECIDAGADGFRFDGAKHIETPDDSGCGSDFWPYVINGATEYAKSSRGIDLYCYGEVLDQPGGSLPVSAYTKYMSVTDNSWGNSLRGSINGGNAGGYNPSYHKSASASQLVVWVESHDTYANEGSGNVSDFNVNKTWALIAARADVMGLYFARPQNYGSDPLGKGSVTAWANPEVKAVNEFHNAFVGTTEYIANENGIAYCERGNAGVILVAGNGSNCSVNVKANKIADGTYVDTITGNTFTVSGGRIQGQIGSTGIAVVWSGKTECDHSWKAATCTAPKTCTKCGETEGTALSHSWTDATCSAPKTCTVCGATEGAALSHTWTDATCSAPKTCSVCGATEGAALGHSWTDASCTAPKTCTVCGATEGSALTHSWTDATCSAPKTCTVCGATEGAALGHSWTDASCTAPKTCTVCGATEGAVGHHFLNGYCIDCGEEDPNYNTPSTVTLTGTGFSLSFEDEILVNFYYTVSDISNVTEQGMLVFYTDPVKADVNKADTVYTGSSFNGTNYMNTTDGIAAKQMGDDRYYAAYVKLSDGTYAYSPLYQYSPKQYATNKVKAASSSAELKALCVAMLNYGAAAQNYFGYKTDDLMNASLTDEQKALVAAYDATLFKGAVAADTNKVGAFAATSGFSGKSASVSFEGAFAINYYFTPSNALSGEMTLYVWDAATHASAAQLTADNAAETVTMVKNDSGVYWGQVSGIAAKALDQTYYVAGVYTDANGNTCSTGVIAYSLSRYCMNNANGDMGALAQGTAMYGYYADAYFAN